jgi:signal transduction histidine kinase
MAIPILSKNKVQGVLCLYSQAPAVFDKSQVAFFENLGRQVGVAIQNARLFEQVRAGRERLRQLAQQVVVAQEEERHRVSRELHDEAGQALTVLKFSLEMVRTALPAEGSPLTREAFDSLRRHLADAVAMCDMTMTGIRQLAHDLRPAALDDLGLHPALEGFCHDFAERTGLIIKYVGGEPPPLPNAFRICFYRFLQEALTNVVRHAQARQVWIELRCTAHLVSLSVADDGQGFDKLSAVSEAGHEKGIGLAGMQERLESLGGRLEIVSQPGQGVRLAAHLPLPTEEASNG